ncbi:MAG TPA: PAS domain S-box protein, partial [Williamwhitmania sp.]|nr:PAS domain S-box protein [Williamwhitmania sp.]
MNSALSKKNRITLALIAVTIAAILTFGGFIFYNYQEQSIRRVKYNELNAIAELKTQQIDRWRKDRLGDANIAAQSPFFQKAVDDYIFNNSNTALRNDILKRMNLLKVQYGYENVMIFSAKGEKILDVNSSIKECEPDKRILTVTSASFSDFFYCGITNHIYLDVAAPISIQSITAKAYLVLRIDPEHYLYPLIQTWPLPSKSGETLLLRKDSTKITFLNELRFSKNAALNLHIDLSHTEVPGVKAALGGTGIYEGYDYRKVMVVSDIRHIPDSHWFMVAKIDKSEIFSELYYRAIGIVAIILISTILITIVLALYFKNRQTSIYKKLFLAEKELRSVEEEFRTILYSIADAVITTAIDGKVKMMNHMAEKLTGWMESEASSKKLEEIFHLVTEGINDPVEYSLKKVRCDKNSVIQDYRVMLVARNGKKVPITTSMASITTSSNKANGVVIVFHDQTAEREAAQKLEENEELFRNVFEYSLIGKSITDLHGKINVNRAFCQMLGYTKEELSSKPWRSITHPDDIERDQHKVDAISAGAKPFDKWEKRYIHKNGTVVYCEIMTTLLRDAAGNMLYFISAINDITERKKMEQALRDSEAILRETGRIAQVGGWEFDVATLKGTWTEEVALIHDLDPKDETNVEVGLSFYSSTNRAKIEQAIANA